jgi:asparaginyl-tRNA synthetase
MEKKMIEKRIKHILTLPGDSREVFIEGWIRTKRDSKEVSFIAVNDGSTMGNIQIVIDRSFPGFEELNPRLIKGAEC